MKTTIILYLFVLSCAGVKLPANFHKCNRNQPDLKECVLRAVQDGLPQLTRSFDEVNLPNLHPFHMSELTIGAGTGPVAVEQKFHNCSVDGFHRMKIKQFELDFEEKRIACAGSFPEIKLQCQYEVDGKILLLPVKGTGPCTIVLTNLQLTALINYEERKNRGKTFIKALSSKVTIDPDMLWVNFENLFNGDKPLGDNINQVLNDNWKDLFEDVRKGYTQAFDTILNHLLNNFFTKVSLEEAFD